MRCAYQNGVLGILAQIDKIKEKTIRTLMEDNGVTEEDLLKQIFKIKIDYRNSRNQKFILLLDSCGDLVDGYRMDYSFSNEGIRVEVFKI